MTRSDPIRKQYYDAVEVTDSISDGLFYVGVALTFLTLLLDKDTHPKAYTWTTIAFAIDAVALFFVGLVLRLHLSPRALDKRRQDFLSSAYGVNLIPEKTSGYYNNELTDSSRRLAAQVLENSHFSRNIALHIVNRERFKIGIYLVLLLAALLYRRTDLGLIIVASQVVLSEHIVSKWLRIEWLRWRSEKIFEDVYSLFQMLPVRAQFQARALDAFVAYETAKANAGITFSTKIFEKLNPKLSQEWESIKDTLKI